MRVFLTNLGCKLNQAETDAIARRLAGDGHQIVPSLEQADLHVVNTCTVTHHAARDSRKTARRARRSGLEIKTAITGCWATGSAAEATGLAGVDLVVPNGAKPQFVDRLYQAFPELRPGAAASSGVAAFAPFQPVRAPLAIEDGCDMECGFCIIPHTRGSQHSREPDEVIAEARLLHDAGCREVVLTGVQISAYRHGGVGLRELVERLLAETEMGRFRLTSIAPWQLDDRLLGSWSNRLCRHLHLSLQSGCDATLRRMRRPYTTARFAETVERARRAIPGVALSTDVITGYPGETTDDFERSLEFVAGVEFARIHVFTYSERSQTRAAGLPGPVPVELRRERTARMLEVADAAERAFRGAQVGRQAQVLWEDRRGGCRRGTTDNYLRVCGRRDGGLPVGDFEWVRFCEPRQWTARSR